MNRIERMELAKRFGTVKFSGRKYWLADQAQADNYGTEGAVRYSATAFDRRGNKYKMEWDTTAEYDKHQNEYHNSESDKYDGEFSCGYCEDESNACDWENPINVIPC